MRILVTGSRDWTDYQAVYQALREHKPTYLILGDCHIGVDCYATTYAEAFHVPHQTYPVRGDR